MNNFYVTDNFYNLENCKKKIILCQGGTRSGKTYSILQWYIIQALKKVKNKIFSITRSTMPALRSTAMRDYFDILKKNGWYKLENHNKTNNEYILNSNLFEFFSLDEDEKVRGRKRDYLFINEALTCPYDIWQQLLFRTTQKVIVDFNPSALYHYFYDEVINRKDAELFITTYKNNTFIPKENLKEILRLKKTNKNLWRIYGEGEKGIAEDIIYPDWQLVDYMPTDKEFEYICYGMDFGFNNPSCVIKAGIKDKYNLYIDELLYQTYLINSQLIDKAKKDVDMNKDLFADSAEPDRIKEFENAGFNIYPVKKSGTSIKDGIDKVKKYKIYITKKSSNILDEIKTYSWKRDKKTDRILDEPVKFKDHSMDAIRYAVMSIKDNSDFHSWKGR